MFDKNRIAKCKKGVVIVNNGRGAIMDTQAIVDACTNGHVAGNSKTNSTNCFDHQNMKLILKLNNTIICYDIKPCVSDLVQQHKFF